MTARAPDLTWDTRGRLFLGNLAQPVAQIHPHRAAEGPECVGLIRLPGIERPRGGSRAEVARALETAVREWFAGAAR